MAASVALAMSACAGSNAPSSSPDAGAPTPDGSSVPLPEPKSPPENPLPFGPTSAELVGKLTLGWNLGNSLDVPEGEDRWNNPRVTPELLQAVAAAGFDLVRIPVTWSKRMGPGPSYTIEPAQLERVGQVVDYAHAAGLYAIINLHHDGADAFEGVEWLRLTDEKGATTEENNAAVKARFIAVWSQIATYFSKYGEELLFESMNEVHEGYATPDPRHFPIINELNQQFVNVVRGSGGNNGQRHLVVPGYNTNIDHTVQGFRAPSDPTPNRLILSVHFYDPYLFTLEAKIHTWGTASPGRDTWGQEDYVVAQFDKVKANFVDKGLPVLLGEYGATHQQGYEDYRRYYLEYVTKVATDRGVLPVYWDNGGRDSGPESFGLIDRNTGEVLHPALLATLKKAATMPYALSEIALPMPAP